MKNYRKVKPLQTGRQILSWFCTDACDEPLNKYQMLARHIFRFIFVIIFTAMFVAANSSLLTNHTSVNDIDELFFGLFQFTTTLHTASAAIVTFVCGPKLASLFQGLENIYNACKNLLDLLSKRID